jgi:hypothetical protein
MRTAAAVATACGAFLLACGTYFVQPFTGSFALVAALAAVLGVATLAVARRVSVS